MLVAGGACTLASQMPCLRLDFILMMLLSSQANVMLEYTHDEAIEMLTKNKVTAEEKLVGGLPA